MKFALSLLIFILLSAYASASWQSYQNDLKNTGSSSEIGHFPLETINFSNNNYGTNFQPLIDNLDALGNNEIAVFSNNSLVIFDSQLNILSQTKVGSILGQPALFNLDNDNFIEIIFNSRQGFNDYFLAYEYSNSNLQQEFNITLPNEANFSGIKCLTLDNIPSCVFKDKLNYVHIVNLESKTDALYNTSVYNESRQTVPAIGDIDNDGSIEVVFWFNNDSAGGYGFLAFDLNERKADWIADNIFSPLILGSLEIHQLFKLKGQPVLVDLNNDNKLEIAASVFYDDSANTDSTTDWFTEMFVYSANGTKLFSKCEKPTVINSGCNDGSSAQGKWEGTNPFVLDYDKDGVDDICFAKDVKTTVGAIGFYYMALNCYNYNGNEIAKVNLSSAEDGVKGTAMTTDINNDGEKEIITSHDIYILNGKSIFNYPLDTFHPIAVDIDGNNGLDLIWTKGNQIKVFLDSNNYSIDLAVSSEDISFLKFDESHINVSIVIRNYGQIGAKNVKIVVYNTETLENNTAIFDLRGNGNITFSSVLAVKEGEKVLASVDYDNEIEESDEANNFAFREFEGLPYVFVSSTIEPPNIDSEFKDYIKNKLTSGYYTTNENEADVKAYIGKGNPINIVNNVKTLEDFGYGYDYGNIIYYDKTGSNPYSGLVAAFKEDASFGASKVTVMIAGNEIEGDIAAAKEFVRNQALFLNAKDKESVFIDDENADAVKVYDYLHVGGNEEHYKANNDEFKKIVKNSLYDTMFTAVDRTVMTSNGITLRLRNLRANFSNDYLEYLSSNGVPVDTPVVLAHGLFSNLTTWEILGAELANVGRDAWLIEITGGPGQDCDNCIDYTFYNLTDIFVPALLNGVLDFTNKDKLQYVGFSNGCRAALDSLERNQFDSNKIETFVAVGCPGSFEGNSTLGDIVFSKNGEISRKLESIGKTHYTFETIAIAGLFNKEFIPKAGSNKISLKLWKFYEDIISSNSDTQPGNVVVQNFIIIQGSALTSDDGIVSIKDEQKIYQNVDITNSKKHFDIFALHSTLDGKDRTKSIIRKSLNKQELNFYEKTINLINQSN